MDLRFDAATRINGELYMFQGKQFRKVKENSHKTFPIKEKWTISNHDYEKLDAVYETPRKEVWLFEGNKVHIFNATSHRITTTLREHFGFSEDISKIDAIFSNPEDQLTYVITGNKQWTLDDKDSHLSTTVIEPKWEEAFSKGINTVFKEDNNLVFLKDGIYYIFNSETKVLSPASQLGPRYFNCRVTDGRDVIQPR